MAEGKISVDHPDLSQISEYLFLSSLPKDEHAEHIFSLGIRLIISMPVYRPPQVYRRPPFQFIHCPSLDSPITPIPQFILKRGVHRALPVINEQGHAVLVHCKEGIHRSVAMACCILVASIFFLLETINMPDKIKSVRDRRRRYHRTPDPCGRRLMG